MKSYYLVLALMISVMFNITVENPAQAQSAPIQITNCQELQDMNSNLAGNYQLANDIDCSATSTWNNGRGFQPVGVRDFGQTPTINNPFIGQFDGQGHAINNLYIDGTVPSGNVSIGTSNPNGLFGSVNGSVIINTQLKNAAVKGAGNSGVLVGELISGTIDNVKVDGKVTGSWSGGLVGVSYSQSINEASANVQVNGTNSVNEMHGGLIGYSNEGPITNSYATGSVININGTGSAYSGGLIGLVNNTSIINCYSTASIVHKINVNDAIGGLIGSFSTWDSSLGYLSQSYAAGSIQLTGSAPTAATYVGGLVGQVPENPITANDSYWDINTTGQTQSVGSPDSNGKTTAQMYQQATYVGWDFISTWISDNQGYPVFLWQEQSQINLWDTFSAVLQENLFESIDTSANAAVNWTNINGALSAGVNWTDVLILSRPPVWNDQPVTANTVNWTYLAGLSDSYLNWTDVTILSRSAIDWASVNPLVRSGINWADWVVATRSTINWENLSTLSNQGVNWTNIGTVSDSVNWTSLAGISTQGINWRLVSQYSQENVNWDSEAILNALKLNPESLHTLRTIGVDAPNAQNAAATTVQLTVNLTGSATGTITSSPSGINCTSGSGVGCSAVFLLNQPVSFSFTSINNSVVTSWGGCTVTGANSCTVTPDQNIVLNIAVNLPPSEAITTTTLGSGSGRILCNGNTCPASVPPGTSITFTGVPNSGSVFAGWGGVCAAPGGSPTGPCTVDNINSPISVSATFNLIPPPTYTITTSTNGSGSGKILCNGTTCPASVPAGTSITFSAIANPGSVLVGINVCSSPGGTTASCTDENINSNTNVIATFALLTYNITASAATGGTITPSGSIKVNYGGQQTFTIAANKDYKINEVLVDNKVVKLSPENTYTFSDVTAAHTISASFTQTAYVITASAGTGGRITPSGAVTVKSEGYQIFIITADRGYKVNEVLVDNKVVKLLLGSIYIFKDVTAVHTISASFTPIR